MTNVINQILEIDKQAKELLEQANQQCHTIKAKANEESELIQCNYMNRVSHRVEIIEQTEQKLADEKMASIEVKRQSVFQALDMAYTRDHEKWEQEIYARVLGR